MIRTALLAAVAMSHLTAAAQAEGLTSIRTPAAERLAGLATTEHLHRLALANLIATNCTVAGLSPGDAALIAGSAQEVAALMGLSTEDYFKDFIGPALPRFGTDGACEREADLARDTAAKLRAMGGEVLSQE